MRYEQSKVILEEYVYGQQESYLDSLQEYDEGLVKAVEINFREKEWSFNGQSREWVNERMQVAFKGSHSTGTGASNIGTSTSGGMPASGPMTPLQYLIDSNRRLLLTAPCQGFEDIQGVSEALSGLLS